MPDDERYNGRESGGYGRSGDNRYDSRGYDGRNRDLSRDRDRNRSRERGPPGFGAKRSRDEYERDDRRDDRNDAGQKPNGRDSGAEHAAGLNGNGRNGREDTLSSTGPRVPLSLDELLKKQAEEKNAEKVRCSFRGLSHGA